MLCSWARQFTLTVPFSVTLVPEVFHLLSATDAKKSRHGGQRVREKKTSGTNFQLCSISKDGTSAVPEPLRRRGIRPSVLKVSKQMKLVPGRQWQVHLAPRFDKYTHGPLGAIY